MKKLIFLLIVSSYFFACKDQATKPCTDCDTDTLTTAELAAYPEYNKDYVQAMVNYYFTLPKTNENIIRGLPYTNPPIRKLLKNAERINAYVGAYLNDTLGVKKGTMNVILQIKKNGLYKYYDYRSIFGEAILKIDAYCPPPKDLPCPIEAKTDSLQ
jgi:hypothetical protein